MKTTVTGRHIDMTPALKAYAEERVKHLERYSSRATEAAVILTVEKYRHQAEVSVNVNGVVIQAKEETQEMYASIDQAVGKVERQLKKHQDRLHDHRQRTDLSVGNGAEPENDSPPDLIPERLTLEVMTPEGAAVRLDASPQPFLVFRHATTSEVNVAYRKADGTLGWIAPAS